MRRVSVWIINQELVARINTSLSSALQIKKSLYEKTPSVPLCHVEAVISSLQVGGRKKTALRRDKTQMLSFSISCS